jgi:peptidyl-prolyl cis-trans isomerase D
MLKLLRKKKVTKRIFYCLAIIIIPAFVIWGSASVLDEAKTSKYAGIIFGKKISRDDFQAALTGWKIQVKIQLGESADQAIQSYFNPIEAAWSRLILLHEVRSRKIKIQDSEVINAITQMPMFQRNGRFDEQTYKAFLQYFLNLPGRTFEEVMRQNLALGEVFKQITASVTVTDPEIKEEYLNQNEETRIQYVSFNADKEKDKINVSEEEIKNFYEKSREQFRVPPQINVLYVHAEFKEDASQQDKEALTKKIEGIYSDAQKRDFEKAALKANVEIKETGLFRLVDPIPTLGWLPDLSTLLFDLSQGSISKVVMLKRGVYLFKIKEKKQAYIPDFKEAKEKVKEALVLEKAKTECLKKAEKFLLKVKTENLSFENAAKELEVQVKETPLFSREAYIPEIGLAQPLKDAAFKLGSNEASDKTITLEQGFYCIKNIETKKVVEETFLKEKDEFAKQLLEQKRNKFFNDFFENLKKRAGLISYVDDAKTR